jgi:uncharacterized protein YbjQ (UPF0145 family)
MLDESSQEKVKYIDESGQVTYITKVELHQIQNENKNELSKTDSPNVIMDSFVNESGQMEYINTTELASERAKVKHIIITTAPLIEGYRVIQTIEIVSSECVYGMNIFKDYLASLTDFFGGRSKATQKVLRDARRQCLEELKHEALSVGANAVIAVDLDYSEISGGGKSMLFLVATGTAVTIEKI